MAKVPTLKQRKESRDTALKEIDKYKEIINDDSGLYSEKAVENAKNKIKEFQATVAELDAHITDIEQESLKVENLSLNESYEEIKTIVEHTHMKYLVTSDDFMYAESTSEPDRSSSVDFISVNGSNITRTLTFLSQRITGNKKAVTLSADTVKDWFQRNRYDANKIISDYTAHQDDDRTFNRARALKQFWIQPDYDNYESYNPLWDDLYYCVGGGKQENIDHLEKWFVYKYMYPERVDNTPNIDVIAPVGGNGKGRLVEMVRTAQTQNAVAKATIDELSGKGFNALLSEATLASLDEVEDRVLPSGVYKAATGDSYQRLEFKGKDAVTARRNYNIFASSQKGVIPVEIAGDKSDGGAQNRRTSVMYTNISLMSYFTQKIRKQSLEDGETISEEEIATRARSRTQAVAEMVLSKAETSKWYAHCIRKWDIDKINADVGLPALHGEDFMKRLEKMKTSSDEVFQQMVDAIKGLGVVPLKVLVSMAKLLTNNDKWTDKGFQDKFDEMLDRMKIVYRKEKKMRYRIKYKDHVDSSKTNQALCYVFNKADDELATFDHTNLISTVLDKKFEFQKRDIMIGDDADVQSLDTLFIEGTANTNKSSNDTEEELPELEIPQIKHEKKKIAQPALFGMLNSLKKGSV
jgi:hypothetical protein